MDINNLNKHQFISLVMLIVFVLSVTTSVVTNVFIQQKITSEEIEPTPKVIKQTIEKIINVESPSKITSEDLNKLLKKIKDLENQINVIKNKKEAADNIIDSESSNNLTTQENQNQNLNLNTNSTEEISSNENFSEN